MPVGIARTAPAWRGRPEIREIEALYHDAIASARETVYLESQYLASQEIGEALAARLAEPRGPEVIIVNPRRSPSWIEQVAMDNARTQMVHRLREADRYDRFRLFAATNAGREIVVHSKVMIVDGRLLRVGSANLNNRSMGLDTECDLAIEAVPGTPNEGETRESIGRFRNDLIAEHLGLSVGRFSRAVAEHGSVIRAIEGLNGASERRLSSFPPAHASKMHEIEHNPLADPLARIGARTPPRPCGGFGRHRWRVAIGLIAAAVLAGVLARRRAPGRG